MKKTYRKIRRFINVVLGKDVYIKTDVDYPHKRFGSSYGGWDIVTEGIADYDGEASFIPPENPEHVSHTLLERTETKNQAITVPVRKLSTIMKNLGHKSVDILKMDIEGAEYAVIDDLRDSSIKPKQLLIEFHHRFDGVGIYKTIETINIIKKMGYAVFSVPESGEEICFIRK